MAQSNLNTFSFVAGRGRSSLRSEWVGFLSPLQVSATLHLKRALNFETLTQRIGSSPVVLIQHSIRVVQFHMRVIETQINGTKDALSLFLGV